jgi:hypothetical protein
MILHVPLAQADQPRISSNQLGEYIFATPLQKLRILQNHKFGNKVCAPYYSPALRGIMHSFQGGTFDSQILMQEVELVNAQPAEKAYHQRKRENNINALKAFIKIGVAANPPRGKHHTINRNALVPLDGVLISARPEIVTENQTAGFTAFTKLRISKSKVSADAQEIVLLVLLHYGQQQSHEGLTFNMELTRLIDCFSNTIVFGHAIPRHRHQQLHSALAEIRTLWPNVKARES